MSFFKIKNKKKIPKLKLLNCDDLFYVTVNGIILSYELLVRKRKQFRNVTLGFRKLWLMSFPFFLIIENYNQQINR